MQVNTGYRNSTRGTVLSLSFSLSLSLCNLLDIICGKIVYNPNKASTLLVTLFTQSLDLEKLRSICELSILCAPVDDLVCFCCIQSCHTSKWETKPRRLEVTAALIRCQHHFHTKMRESNARQRGDPPPPTHTYAYTSTHTHTLTHPHTHSPSVWLT